MAVKDATGMLAAAVKGLPPLQRALRMEAVALATAKRFATQGSREKELFWLELAQKAGNEAARLRREEIIVTIVPNT